MEPLANRRRLSSWLRPRITLRLLLALITLFCVWLAIHVHRARRQQAAVKFHEVRSSRMYYDYMPVASARSQGLVSPRDRRATSPVPAWLLKPLGEDFFHSVVEVEIYDCDQLRDLAGFPGLEAVWTVGNGINDQDIEHVSRLGRLRQFHVRGAYNIFDRRSQSDLTDRGLQFLAQMPRLEVLAVTGSFSAKGLAVLAESRSLRDITVIGCDDSVTPAAAELFRAGGRVQRLSLRKWPPAPQTIPVLTIRLLTPGAAAPVEDDGLIAEW